MVVIHDGGRRGQRGMVTGRNFQGAFSELVFLFLGPDTVTRMCSLQENSLHLCSSLNEQRYTSIKSLLQQKCYRDIWRRLNNYFWTKDVRQTSKRLPTEDIWLNPWCPKRFQKCILVRQQMNLSSHNTKSLMFLIRLKEKKNRNQSLLNFRDLLEHLKCEQCNKNLGRDRLG